jgi:hypothetical protein
VTLVAWLALGLAIGQVAPSPCHPELSELECSLDASRTRCLRSLAHCEIDLQASREIARTATTALAEIPTAPEEDILGLPAGPRLSWPLLLGGGALLLVVGLLGGIAATAGR